MVLTGMLDIGRFSVAAGSLGIINACLEASSAYTSTRTVSGTRSRLHNLRQKRAQLSAFGLSP